MALELYRVTSLYEALHEALEYHVQREDLPDSLLTEAEHTFDEECLHALAVFVAPLSHSAQFHSETAAWHRSLPILNHACMVDASQAIRDEVMKCWTHSASEQPLTGKIKVWRLDL